MNPEVSLALLDTFPLLVPEFILVVAACVLFLAATFRVSRHFPGAVALAALALAGVAAYLTPTVVPAGSAVFGVPLVFDPLAQFVRWVALAGGAVLVLLSWDEVPDRLAGEYHGCLLVLAAGLSLTGAANELITLFLALEMISIPTYVLLYLPRQDEAAQEAAMKYFLLSILSSALLLFGFSYLYGLGGTTNIPGLIQALNLARLDGNAAPGLALVALVMVVAGLGFRLTAVPFHFYAPDVYQGAPTAGAALLAFVPKVAAVGALFRVLGFVLPGHFPENGGGGLAFGGWLPSLFLILSVVTMTLGNVLALLQDNLKRLLAYSSVAHAGYMLIGLTVAQELRQTEATGGGLDAVLFYLVAYGAMTLGAFAVLAYLSTPQRPVENVDDLRGLWQHRPGLTLLMSLFLFSLIGIPLTAGFMGKLLVFWGAVSFFRDGQLNWYTGLAIVGAVNAAIGGWYYLRVVAVMTLQSPDAEPAPRRSLPGLATLWICAALTLGFGVYPKPLADAARRAAGAPPAVENLRAEK